MFLVMESVRSCNVSTFYFFMSMHGCVVDKPHYKYRDSAKRDSPPRTNQPIEYTGKYGPHRIA